MIKGDFGEVDIFFISNILWEKCEKLSNAVQLKPYNVLLDTFFNAAQEDKKYY